MRIAVLGHLEVHDDRMQPIDLDESYRRKWTVRNLLCVLALADWSLSVAQLTSLLGEGEEALSSVGLRSTVYKARTVLGPLEKRLVTEKTSSGINQYRLVREEGDMFDVADFEALAAQAIHARVAGDLPTAEDLYDRALALWRSEPGEALLPDFRMTPTMRAFITPLLELRAQAVQALIEVRLELGRHDPGLVETIRRCLAFDALDERLYGLLMLTLHRMGRRSEALRAFEEVSLLLAGQAEAIEPARMLHGLMARIRADDPMLMHCSPKEALQVHRSLRPAALAGSAASAQFAHTELRRPAAQSA
ncbi:AfsR/SARP family transcriptional regulator [Actinomadura napierensis]|uniref:AfsR/SARP family transcriptional regulator n=1 Tax=Actinomadura napierensis TaxID=267854 RepID=UPI0031D958F4